MNRLQSLGGEAIYDLLTMVGQRPRLVLPLARVWRYGVPFDRRTEIVIEGFPRSGNTFAVAAFRRAQGRPVWIAHHVHAPGHVVAAVRAGLPTLVLIAPPAVAVVEFSVAKPTLGVAVALRGYLRFYDPLVRLLRGVVVSTTDEVMTDVGAAIRRVNERFGTAFREFVPTEENVRAVLDQAGRDAAARPGIGLPVLGSSADRPPVEGELLRRTMLAAYQRPELSAARARAEALFRALSPGTP